MLAHSPRLPLILDYYDENHDITAEEEDAIMLALSHRDRVRRIRLSMPVQKLQKLVTSMGNGFSALEDVVLGPLDELDIGLVLPKTFQAPQLRHLLLRNFAFPIQRSPLLMTAVGIVALSLVDIHQSSYFSPNDLLQQLSLMPQLETLGIAFHCPVPNRDVERQLWLTPIMIHVTLPNLRWFWFKGVSAYLEALLPHMTTALLERLQIIFYTQLTISVPCLLQFISTTECFKPPTSATFTFYDRGVAMGVSLPTASGQHFFAISVLGCHLDWQVSSIAQIFNVLGPVFSTVEHLSLKHEKHSRSSATHDGAEGTQWRNLLRSFSNLKTVHVPDSLFGELSRCLQLSDGESSVELLPEVDEESFSASADVGGALVSFVDARQNASHRITLVRY
jgi:hypothetical protein